MTWWRMKEDWCALPRQRAQRAPRQAAPRAAVPKASQAAAGRHGSAPKGRVSRGPTRSIFPPMTNSVRDHLRALSFLEGLTDTAVHQLAHLVQPAEFACDEMLFEEGQPRQLLALVVSGAVAIEKQESGRPVRLATLGPGEAVGEGLLLDDSPHGTSARPIVPTTCYVLSRAQVETMLKESPTLYAALVARAARAISQRLSAVDATLVGRGRALGFGGARTRREHDLDRKSVV